MPIEAAVSARRGAAVGATLVGTSEHAVRATAPARAREAERIFMGVLAGRGGDERKARRAD
jgi:hypothetical protein